MLPWLATFSCAKYCRYLSDILRIKNIFLFQPASSGDINSVACMSYLTHAVGIRIDDQCHPERLGAFCLQPIDVESLGVGVDLDNGAVLCGRLENSLEIDLVAFSPQQE